MTVITAAILTLSCENVVEEMMYDQNKSILVMNAQILQDAHTHKIYLHSSVGGQSNPIYDADVVYSINGGDEIKAEPVIIEGEINNYDFIIVGDHQEIIKEYHKLTGDGYVFDADLAPGDEIYFRATWMGQTTFATVTIPDNAAAITAVDTTRVVIESQSDLMPERYRRQYGITVKDDPDEKSYYFLRFDDAFYRLDASGNRVTAFAARCAFDATVEPLLRPIENSGVKDLIKGSIPTRINSPIGIVFGEYLSIIAEDIDDTNNYQAFSDELFEGGSYTLKVNDTGEASYRSQWADFWKEFQEGDSYCLDRTIKVYAISPDEYLYLRAICIENNNIGQYITEPAVYPGNVAGGLGFVAAATPVTWTIHFPPEPYTGKIPENAYRY